MLRKILPVFLVLSFVMACLPTSLGTNTPTPTASATTLPTNTATQTPRPTKTATATITVTPLVPLSEAEVTIKPGTWQTVGADYGATIAYDEATKLLAFINDDFRMKVTAGENPVKLKVATYAKVSDAELMAFAEKMFPDAEIKFWARPSFALSEGWTGQLPVSWEYAKVPDFLQKRNDYWQETVENPRTAVLQWVYLQVTCERYDKDPGKNALPPGIRWDRRQVYQVFVLKYPVSLKAICGNRENGVHSVWANQFTLLDKNTTQQQHEALMADAITWMLSQNVQEKMLDGATNFARFIAGEEGLAGWQLMPDEFYGKGG